MDKLRMHRSRLHDAASMAAVGGSGLVVLGAALPWVSSGGVRRSAFTVVRVANELGVFERTTHRLAVLSLLGTPAVASLGLLLMSAGRQRSAAVALLSVALLGLFVGAVGLRFSSGGQSGPMVTTMGGVVGTVGSLASLRRRPSAGFLPPDQGNVSRS